MHYLTNSNLKFRIKVNYNYALDISEECQNIDRSMCLFWKYKAFKNRNKKKLL